MSEVPVYSPSNSETRCRVHPQTCAQIEIVQNENDLGWEEASWPPASRMTHEPLRFRAKWKQHKMCSGLHPQSPGQHLALTGLCVPYSLDSSTRDRLVRGISHIYVLQDWGWCVKVGWSKCEAVPRWAHI